MADTHSTESIEQQFLNLVVRIPATGCWAWLGGARGGKDRLHRYGCFLCHGEQYYAHRFSYTLFNGPIPEGLNVLHRCDIPFCVNPVHLFTGNIGDNNRDRTAKGRSAKGSRHGSAKLTEQQVSSIREQASNGCSVQSLSEIFQVARRTIRGIISREYWSHI